MNCLLATLLTASLTVAAEPKADFAFREINPAGLELTDGGKPVFDYNFGTITSKVKGAVPRSCYIHPVYAPNSVLTQGRLQPQPSASSRHLLDVAGGHSR